MSDDGPIEFPGEDEEACLSVVSLRDLFAAHALTGILAGHCSIHGQVPHRHGEVLVAQGAYLAADAMLAARNREQVAPEEER